MPYPSPSELETIFDRRAAAIKALHAKAKICLTDLSGLDRLGRCAVANDLWGKADAATKQALLNDEHPHVRSCARISRHAESNITGREIARQMRQSGVTIRTLAERMNITQKRVREVRMNGVVDNACMVLDWREAIAGTGFFAGK